MPAAFCKDANCDRFLHGASKVDTSNRPSRAGANTFFVECDCKGWTAESFFETRGDKTEHARMPAPAGSDNNCGIAGLIASQRRLRFFKRKALKLLALTIELVELRRD